MTELEEKEKEIEYLRLIINLILEDPYIFLLMKDTYKHGFNPIDFDKFEKCSIASHKYLQAEFDQLKN